MSAINLLSWDDDNLAPGGIHYYDILLQRSTACLRPACFNKNCRNKNEDLLNKLQTKFCSGKKL